MFSDWRAWRLAVVQAALLGLIILVAVAGGRWLAPPLVRLVTGTPEPLLAAAQALGVEPNRALLTGWAELPASTEVTSADLGQTALRAMHILAGADLEYGPVLVPQEDEPEAHVVEYNVVALGVVYRSRARLIGQEDQIQLYLVCSAEVRQPAALKAIQERVDAALNTLGRGTVRREPVYVTVFAKLDEVLDQAGQRAASRRIATRLRGREVHVHAGEALYSLLSHSIMLGPSVPVAGKQVNLSVVLRPDAESGCTWIVIGTPLCAGDY